MSRIAIVGAGIIGASIATRLTADGHDVTVYEREPEGLPASAGNASLIALPEIAPIASPGMLGMVPKWLADPLGPLTIRWSDVPALLPWLLAFLSHATPAHGRHARKALGGLMQTALADLKALGETAGLSGHLRQTGYIALHDSEASLNGGIAEASDVERILGYPFEPLTPAAARAKVPQVEGRFFGAIYQPRYVMVSNPLTVLRHYQQGIRERGRLVTTGVTALASRPDGVAVVTPAGEERFDRAVIAAGVWSRELVRALGQPVMLETERGYNTTFTDLSWTLPMPVGFADQGFIATPLVDGLRVGGAVELARPGSPPNFGRARAMREKMRRYVPALPEGGVEWMGRRPSTPDSLPVIGLLPGDPRIALAFGHGHLGLTLSAVTARLVSELIAGRSPDVAAFSVARFGQSAQSGSSTPGS